MIRGFLYSWLLYWTLVLLVPVHSVYPAVTAAFLLQLAFLVLVVAGYFVASPQCREFAMPSITLGEIPSANQLITISLWMSLIGFLMLLYDKVYIQQIDYTKGVALARQQWADLGEAREGRASSIWSILGYALGSGYYLAAVLVVTQSSFLSGWQRFRAIGSASFFVLANSVITGGRSNFMLLAFVSLAALSARHGLRIRSVFTSRRQRRVLGILLGLSGCYIVFIFFARASAGDQAVYQYVVNYLPWMGVDFDNWYVRSVNEGWIGTVGNMTVLVLGYLTHSFATTAAIIEAPYEDKLIIFNNVADILYKLGVMHPVDSAWFLAGRFPTVPGALWHEFRAGGFVIASLLLGLTAGWTSLWMSSRPRRLLPLGLYTLVGATLFLTPYVFAPDFLSFPPVLVAVVILAALSRLVGGPRRVQHWANSSGEPEAGHCA